MKGFHKKVHPVMSFGKFCGELFLTVGIKTTPSRRRCGLDVTNQTHVKAL